MTSHRTNTAALPGGRPRRGSALFLVLIMTVALAAMALSAIFLGSHDTLVTKAYERERDYRYAAEAALAMGRAQLGRDADLVLDDSLPTRLLTDAQIRGTDGSSASGVDVNMWVARTGSKTGQHGLYASIIAEAKSSAAGGARFVRRLELMEENFARFLDWSDREVQTMCYGTGEVMNGPVWSNSNIGVCGGHFRDSVGMAGIVKQYMGRPGRFDKDSLVRQPKIAMPNTDRLARLKGYAQSGLFAFNAPSNGNATTARMRIEFVWWDLDGDGTGVGDDNEGFFRVFRANKADELRADYRSISNQSVRQNQCGDWHYVGTELKFFPVGVHDEDEEWMQDLLEDNWALNNERLDYEWGDGADEEDEEEFEEEVEEDVEDHLDEDREEIMEHRVGTASPVTPRCFPAGDPHLVATETDREEGGDSKTFTGVTSTGEWLAWPGTPVPWGTLGIKLPPEDMRPYLFPISRTLNGGTKGVIHVDGTVALSGVLRGRITVHATGHITFIDDLTYAVHPSSDESEDMLGIISEKDITIADNGINTPQNPRLGGDIGPFAWMDDNEHFHLHGVLMALGTFVPERFTQGPRNMTTCNGQTIGRGCLYQIGGAIVFKRDATYTSNKTGFMEVRDYDRRMMRDSPPYFPTTGRYFDNRFYEVDPLNFDITDYLLRIGQRGS